MKKIITEQDQSGGQSGQLTPKEPGKVEAQQARVQQREYRMAARNGSNYHCKGQDETHLTIEQGQ